MKHGFLYLLSSALNKGLSILILPVITNVLSPVEFGKWATFQTFISFILPMILFSLSTKVNREFFIRTKNDTAVCIGNSVVISGVLTLVILLCIVIFNLLFGAFKSIDFNLVLFIPFISFFSMISIQYLSVLRNLNCAIEFAFIEIIRSILNVLLILFFIFHIKFGWTSLLYSMVISYCLTGIFSLYRLFKTNYLVFKPNVVSILNYIKFSYPLVPHALSGVIIFTSDRLFIYNYFGEASVGFYTVGYTFSMLILLISDAYSKVWNPWFFKNMDNVDDEIKLRVVRYSYIYILFLSVLLFVTILGTSTAIDLLLPIEYMQSKSVILFIVLGLFSNAIASLFFPYLIILGKTKSIGYITLTAAGCNILLNILLIPIYGIIGAAISTFITFFLRMILMIYLSNQNIVMPWLSNKLLTVK